jgi:NhaC family Na+:H+ antiporter
MCWTINLVIVAVSLGGILEKIGVVESLMGGLIHHARKPWQAVLLVMLTSLFCDWAMCDRYLAIIIPGKMYQEKFDELGLGRNMLSRSLEDLGTLWSPMCPWNTCGAYQASVLGMSPFAYIPFAFMNLINPIFALVTAIFGRQLLYADGCRTTMLFGRLKIGGKPPEAPEEAREIAYAALREQRDE